MAPRLVTCCLMSDPNYYILLLNLTNQHMPEKQAQPRITRNTQNNN